MRGEFLSYVPRQELFDAIDPMLGDATDDVQDFPLGDRLIS